MFYSAIKRKLTWV